MYSKVYSEALLGVESILIDVEADVSNGLPCFHMVGYLSSEVREAKERVHTALKNSGFCLPPKRITVNLSPADIRKEGSAFDLSIAIAILAAIGQISNKQLNETVFIGELALNGDVLQVNGVLSMVHQAKILGKSRIVVPKMNLKEGSVIEGIEVIGVSSLMETVEYLNGRQVILPGIPSESIEKMERYEVDFNEIRGQTLAKRAIEIAAGGMHNMIMIGPPGSGKSMLAKRMPTILPPLTKEESIEISKIYSVKGMLPERQGLIKERPFRSPHHTISQYALAGGGKVPVPGEMSLAEHGVLFLDELPEFSRNALEVMRQPLEDGEIVISRVNASYKFPAHFVLLGALNPCPCGYYPDRNKCNCSETMIRKYLNRISRALLDRIDLCVEVQRISYKDISAKVTEESSADIRKRVEKVHEIQKERNRMYGVLFNSHLSGKALENVCEMGKNEKKILEHAYDKFGLSARGYAHVLKVARTIADFSESVRVKEEHIIEALSYHNAQEQYWGGNQ